MNVFLMLSDKPLDKYNLFIVGRQKDAQKLIDCGCYRSYEVINVANSTEVEQVYLDYIARG